MRGGDLPADVGHHDAIRRIRSGCGAVGHVDARGGSQIAAGAGDPVDRRPAKDRVDNARLRHRTGHWGRLGPGVAAVKRARHELEGLLATLGQRGDAKHVGHALAVGADGAAVDRITLPVIGGGADLALLPGCPAVGGCGHD